jgi:hypothetical protein
MELECPTQVAERSRLTAVLYMHTVRMRSGICENSRNGHSLLHVRPKRQRRYGRSEVLSRPHSSRDGRAATHVMADVAPMKLSLRHLTFVILVHRLVAETAVRQIEARSRVSVFPGQVQRPEQEGPEGRCDGRAHAGSPSASQQVRVEARPVGHAG